MQKNQISNIQHPEHPKVQNKKSKSKHPQFLYKFPTYRLKRPVYFEGVSVTTAILAPGACGRGLRAALLDTTSPAAVAAVAPVAVFQKSPISCYLSYLRARDLSKINPNPSLAPGWPRGGSRGARESLGRVWRSSGRVFGSSGRMLGG